VLVLVLVIRTATYSINKLFIAYGERRGAYRFLVWKMREGDHLEDPGVDRAIILRWIFRKWDGEHDWIGL